MMARLRRYWENALVAVVTTALVSILLIEVVDASWWIVVLSAAGAAVIGLLVGDTVLTLASKTLSLLRTWLLAGLHVPGELDARVSRVEDRANSIDNQLRWAKEAADALAVDLVTALEDAVELLYVRGRHDEVIQHCESLVRRDQSNFKGYYYRGLSFAARGFHSHAREDLKIASELRQDDADVHMALAETYLNLGAHDDAIDEANAAWRLNFSRRNPLRARTVIARALEEAKRYPEALEARGQCLDLSSTHAASVEAKIRILTEMAACGQKDWQDVFPFADEAINRQPEQASYRAYKALAHLRRGQAGDWEDALSTFSDATNADPRDNKSYYHWARALLDAAQGETDSAKQADMANKAMNVAKRGNQECKRFPDFHDLCRQAYLLLGQTDEARKEAKEHVRANPTNPWAYIVQCIEELRAEDAGQAAEISEQTFGVADFARGPYARIWLLFINCVSELLRGTRVDDLRDRLADLVSEIQAAATFRADRWPGWLDLSAVVAKLNEKLAYSLIVDLVKVMTRDEPVEKFAKKWKV